MPLFVTGGAASFEATLFVLAFLLASVGIGSRLLRVLGVREDRLIVERTVVAVLLGAGALQLVPFLLGATSLLSAKALAGALAVVGLIALPDAWAAVRACRRALAGATRERWFFFWLL